MGLSCSICACERKKRKEIDKVLVVSKPNFSAIARRFDVDRGALRRHLAGGHVLEKISKAAKVQESLDAEDLVDELQVIQDHQKSIFDEERENKNNRIALEALRDQSRIIELKGRVRGSFKDAKQGGHGSGPAGTSISQTIIYVPDNYRAQKTEES